MIRPSSATDDGNGATARPSWMRRASRWRSTVLRLALPAALGTALVCGGCGEPPQFSAKDQRLLEALRTAISAHKPDWLEASAKEIDKARQQGRVSDEGFEALQSAITPARTGDWKQAEKQILQLEKGQHPPAK